MGGDMAEPGAVKKVHTDPDFCEVPMSPLFSGPSPSSVRVIPADPAKNQISTLGSSAIATPE